MSYLPNMGDMRAVFSQLDTHYLPRVTFRDIIIYSHIINQKAVGPRPKLIVNQLAQRASYSGDYISLVS